jgi:vanillate O-demethylase monooxygenase subunit
MAVNTQPPVIFDMMWRRARGNYDGPMDHWAESRWDAASLISQSVGVTLSGQPREAGLETRNYHLVTPETENTSHYFWAICRNVELNNEALDNDVRAGTEYAFVEQDEKLLRALQENMEGREFWSLKPVLLPGDAGAVQVRRALDRMIAAENQAIHAGG